MKRIIISLFLLLFGVAAYAGFVPKTQAEEIARKVLGSSSVEYVWNGLGDVKYGDVNPAFYVFNGTEGWAIVSADDCAVPVLMHGEGTFDPDDIPDNMRSLLKNVESNIFAARNQALAQSPEIGEAWSSYSAATKSGSTSPVDSTLLVTAKWNQGAPYYYYCPMDGDARSITGCVATAMSILMRYYCWPEKGKGKIPGYTTRSKGIVVDTIDIGVHEYEWDKMALEYINSTINPLEQQLAVSRLMADAGAMVKMDYSATSSGAYSRDVIPAMVKYMSYSSSARELYRSNYSNSEWLVMIKNEIDALNPILYGGVDVNGKGGHMFVCDGYNSNNEIHINWGWSGRHNAWYAVCYLGSMVENEPGYTGYVFSYDDSAIFGLVPDYSSTGSSEPCLEVNSGAGISLKGGRIAKGDFTLTLSTFRSKGSSYSGVLKAALLDKDGSIKEFISDGLSVSMVADTWDSSGYDFDCTVTEDIHVGDYVSILYECSDDNWEPIHLYNKVTPIGLAALDLVAINIPSAVDEGYVFYPSLTISVKEIQGISWNVDGVSSTAEFIKLTSGTHIIKAVVTYKDGSTETIVKQVTTE